MGFMSNHKEGAVQGLAVPRSHPAAHVLWSVLGWLQLLHAHMFGSRIIVLIWKQIFLSCVSQAGRERWCEIVLFELTTGLADVVCMSECVLSISSIPTSLAVILVHLLLYYHIVATTAQPI